MRIETRLSRIERTVRHWPDPNSFTVVQAIPTSIDGREPGLYPSGGSTGVLVYDPNDGEPVVPDGRLARWGMLIVLDPELVTEPL